MCGLSALPMAMSVPICQPYPDKKPSQPPTFVRDLAFRSRDVVNVMLKLQPQHAGAILKILHESREDLSTFCREVRRQIGGRLLFDAVMVLRGVKPSAQLSTADAKSLYEHAVGCQSPSCSRHGCLQLRSIFSQLRQHARCCPEPDGCNPCKQYRRVRDAIARAKTLSSATSVMLAQPVTLARKVKPISSTNKNVPQAEVLIGGTPAIIATVVARSVPAPARPEASVMLVEPVTLARTVKPISSTNENFPHAKALIGGTPATIAPAVARSASSSPRPEAQPRQTPLQEPNAVPGAGRAAGLLLLAKALGLPEVERTRKALADLPAHSPRNSPGNSPANSPLRLLIHGRKQRKRKYAHSAVYGGLSSDAEEDTYSPPVYSEQDSLPLGLRGMHAERRPHRKGLKHRCKRCGELKRGHTCLAVYDYRD